MTKTKLAEASWPKPKPPKQPKSPSRLDEKFLDWAKRNNINIVDIKLMEKKK
jgi:hypothetical protein